MENLPELIGGLGGLLITLALAYAPGLRSRWEALSGSQKRAVLAACYVAMGAGLYVPSCFGGPQVVACDTSSIWDVVTAVLAALVAGQGMYTALPSQTKARMESAPAG